MNKGDLPKPLHGVKLTETYWLGDGAPLQKMKETPSSWPNRLHRAARVPRVCRPCAVSSDGATERARWSPVTRARRHFLGAPPWNSPALSDAVPLSILARLQHELRCEASGGAAFWP